MKTVGIVAAGPRRRSRSSGQVLVIFGLSIFVLVGVIALVIDVAWYWSAGLRVQRAADAAALAGAVYLPSDVPLAVSTAKAYAAANGYADGVVGVVVTPTQNSADNRRLDVTVAAPIGTFFMRILGINSIAASRDASAEFVLSVPMGSPLNYYGIDRLTRAVGTTTDVPDATGSGTLAPQGNWDAIITKGGNHQNGDAYSPTWDDLRAAANPDYNSAGYPYQIVIPAGDSAGQVWLFDPAFCGVGQNPSGGSYGAGDHWIGTAGTAVSTFYTLYNEGNTPDDWSDDTQVWTSGNTFAGQFQTDQSMSAGNYIFGTPQATTASGVRDCSADPTHNQWWLAASGLAAGNYRLEVATTDPANPSVNSGTNAENMFGIEVNATGPATPQAHGQGRMAVYNSLVSGAQVVYLAQIDKAYSSKTLEIDLFDPGDVSGDAFLKIQSPDGDVYTDVTFSYTADSRCTASCSGTDVTQIQTATAAGSHPFNDSWITIRVKLPATYGKDGLTPPGEPSAGWWKIEYDVSGGNDTTTWRTEILGNPVHLLVP